MRRASIMLAALFVLPTLLAGDVAAQDKQAKKVWRVGPNGKKTQVTHDGCYSTCVRDSRRLGHSAEAARSYCASRPNVSRSC